MMKQIVCPECNARGYIPVGNECSTWGKTCPTCNGYMFVEVPMTNADRIRAMSDEELREWLCSITTCECCRWSKWTGCECLEWLQQPAEGD